MFQYIAETKMQMQLPCFEIRARNPTSWFFIGYKDKKIWCCTEYVGQTIAWKLHAQHSLKTAWCCCKRPVQISCSTLEIRDWHGSLLPLWLWRWRKWEKWTSSIQRNPFSSAHRALKELKVYFSFMAFSVIILSNYVQLMDNLILTDTYTILGLFLKVSWESWGNVHWHRKKQH